MIGPIHFMGIGGAGMSGMAEMLHRRGVAVTGCDIRESPATWRLTNLGIPVAIGHAPEHLAGATRLVASRAVPATDPEIVAARKRGLPVWHRAEMLAALLADRPAIGVAGTHGKTTTAALTAIALTAGGLDPSALVGAEVREFESHARCGSGPIVAEVDESDGSLRHVRAHSVIITSLDLTDHLDHYGDLQALMETFTSFLRGASTDGFVLLCADHPNVLRLRAAAPGRVLTYGLSDGDYRARVLEQRGARSRFLLSRGGRELAAVTLRLPGRHNAANAAAALAAGLQMGGALTPMVDALASFRGVRRRFEVYRESPLVVDDYAHNPVKVQAFLRGLREGWPDARIIAVFQPHRYSRTKTTHAAYAGAFDDADEVIVTNIYAADEAPLPGVSSRLIVDAVGPRRPVHWIPRLEDVALDVRTRLRPGDIVATIGAGDVWRVSEWLARDLEGVPV
ncbi:MAG: UDP-N-acetylmuramate--L-alanine ligase [Armatimonadetes bacterium]|nr:UDP-N-acetylmuramate--L-alanine ligase [Armatimonadota bacterium]